MSLKRSDFDYALPAELIAKHPCEDRDGSRLLVLDSETGALSDQLFTEIESLISPKDLLVFNNTRVIPARLFGQKASGGKVEILVERVVDDATVWAHVKASKRPKQNMLIELLDDAEGSSTGYQLMVGEDKAGLLQLILAGNGSIFSVLESVGHMPLPPYIDRKDTDVDRTRYQTVYAQKPGAVAAPTAGLHFTEALLQRLANKGVEFGYVTLHVGAGTFQPVRVDDIREHHMHAEMIDVDEKLCQQVAACRARGGRVIAVGTTSVRCLETASQSGVLSPFRGDTSIFIYPGYTFKTVDALLTNFHLPESTLIMLVSALAGREQVLNAYRHAVEQQYRFFSYGDAMFIHASRS